MKQLNDVWSHRLALLYISSALAALLSLKGRHQRKPVGLAWTSTAADDGCMGLELLFDTLTSVALREKCVQRITL